MVGSTIGELVDWPTDCLSPLFGLRYADSEGNAVPMQRMDKSAI
jgi:hypothetical protein